jgi:hypothetical protein
VQRKVKEAIITRRWKEREKGASKTTIKERDEKNRMDECDAEGGEEEGRGHFVLLMTMTVTTMMIMVIDKI